MSDYCRYKVVRYPICHGDDTSEVYRKFDDIFERCKCDPFYLTYCIDYRTDTPWLFLDYELFSSYGDESGDFGKTRQLTPKEQDKYERLFNDRIRGLDLIAIDKTKFRLVDYCYYNCCEPDCYYDETTDSFYDEV